MSSYTIIRAHVGVLGLRHVGIVDFIHAAFVFQIVQRYDITLLQEIRDSSESVIYEFLDKLNRLATVQLYINMYAATSMTMCLLEFSARPIKGSAGPSYWQII